MAGIFWKPSFGCNGINLCIVSSAAKMGEYGVISAESFYLSWASTPITARFSLFNDSMNVASHVMVLPVFDVRLH